MNYQNLETLSSYLGPNLWSYIVGFVPSFVFGDPFKFGGNRDSKSSFLERLGMSAGLALLVNMGRSLRNPVSPTVEQDLSMTAGLMSGLYLRDFVSSLIPRKTE